VQPKPKIHPAVAAIIVIVLVGIVTSIVIVVNSAKSDTSSTSTVSTPVAPTTVSDSTTTPTTPTTTPTSTDTSAYKDGTYAATISYATPGGIESIDATVTIKNGVITDSQLVTSGKTDHAEEHQALFASEYKSLIVGKQVSAVSTVRVSGASLTSNAFDDALDKIKQDAKA